MSLLPRSQDLLWPLAGLRHFLARPRLWFAALLRGSGGLLVIGIIAALSLWWHWPEAGIADLNGVIDLAGPLLADLAAALALLLPLSKGSAGAAVLRPVLRERDSSITLAMPKRSLGERAQALLRAPFWPLVWIAAIIAARIQHPWLGGAVALWAIAHLMCLRACDQSLAALGRDLRSRRRALAARFIPVLIASLVAAGMLAVLTISVFGWPLWPPGVFAGAARWTQSWAGPNRAAEDAQPQADPESA